MIHYTLYSLVKAVTDPIKNSAIWEFPGIKKMYRITVDASDVIEEEILEPLTGNVPDICKADIYHMKKEDLKDLCRSVREGDCEVIAIDLE